MAERIDIFEGAVLTAFAIEHGVLKVRQSLPNDPEGRISIGTFYVKGDELRPKGGVIMSAEAFAALAKGNGKAVAWPTVAQVKASAPVKAAVKTKAVLQAENESLMARLAALEAKLAS